MELMKTTIGRLRLLAFFEGVSFLIILFITMPLKYMAEMPAPNKVVGMVHGVLFVGYIALVTLAYMEYKWNFKKYTLAVLMSVVPFGTFWADKKLFRDNV
ncbi:DUF3817 domain-containing protein [Limibacter armeniacum]|uniref:DUF3817 domain-containing protein n=1 Tax=Limibacter armeniacum TaxID=466084 RepID=UPI002FE609F8